MIKWNTATYGGGTANYDTLTAEITQIIGNHATVAGGGIYDAAGTVTLIHSSVAGNKPNDTHP